MILSWVAVALLVCFLVIFKSNLSVGGAGDAELVETADSIGGVTETELHTHLKHTAGNIVLLVVIQTHRGRVERAYHMALLVLVDAVKLLVCALRSISLATERSSDARLKSKAVPIPRA